MADQLSAELEDRFSAGPPTQTPIVRVRDLIVCAGDPSLDVPIEEVYAHPPIGWERHPGDAERFAEIVDMIDLGDGIVIEELDRDIAELVMNACTPRGHYFVPVRQFGQRYSFVKEVALDELEQRHFAWDTDGTLDDALTLSRLVRDHGYSTQYAARLIDYDDGQRCIVYVLHREDKSIYRLRRDREWLDAAEGRELAGLLAAYWECREELPPRVRRAMWRMAYAPRIRWADMVVPILIGGLEALLKVGRHGLTEQFKKRAPVLAADVGIDGFGEDLAERLYDGRSDWVHGSHVQLFAGPSPSAETPGEEEPEGPQSSDEQSALAEVALLQDVLRGAVRRAIEDAEFRQIFVADETIAERWPA
ncbi:MAG TPA: hypothetical protein VGH58_01425 [Solirubrobacterales bacterium]|jgi:hypothetical protein